MPFNWSLMWNSDRPLRNMARLGTHTAPCIAPMQNVCVNVHPPLTIASRLGVSMCGLPRARIVSKRWSSLQMKTTFGRSAARAGAAATRARNGRRNRGTADLVSEPGRVGYVVPCYSLARVLAVHLSPDEASGER